MNRSNFGAVRLPLLGAAVLAIFAVPLSAQIVEKERTFADLTATHPCSSGYTDRNAIVTDCDTASDIGDGGGAFRCFAHCDGTAPWEAVSIGGGSGGGGEATSVQGSATLPATCAELDLYQDTNSGGTEFYVCTATDTWTKTGTIGGTLTATDDLAVCTDGTGGSTIGACTVLNIDDLRLDGNILSNPAGGNISFRAGGATNQITVGSGQVTLTVGLAGNGNTTISGYAVQLFARTQGVGAPLNLQDAASSQFATNEGATAEVYINLPGAATGLHFTFIIQDADGMRITAASGDTIRPIAGTAASATGGFIRCATQGAFITLVAINATEWVAIGSAGVWTIDI